MQLGLQIRRHTPEPGRAPVGKPGLSGRYLGVVTMPPRFVPRIILDGKIYGVWRDELDVQYVLRLWIVEG